MKSAASKFLYISWMLGPFILGLHWIIAQNGDEFQRWGSLVIGFAIINLSLTRARFEKIRSDWTATRLSAEISDLRVTIHLGGKKSDLTTDILTLQAIQTANVIGTPHPWSVATTEELEDLSKSINNRLEDPDFAALYRRNIEHVDKIIADHDAFETTHGPWGRVYLWLEIILLFLGTIQAGYGDRIVQRIYNMPTATKVLDKIWPAYFQISDWWLFEPGIL